MKQMTESFYILWYKMPTKVLHLLHYTTADPIIYT